MPPDYKIFEMNKRLQHRNEDSDNLWWDAFANEFFDDEAQVTLTFCLEDGPKRYSKLATILCPLILISSHFSCWADIDPQVFPEYIRGRCDGSALGAETLERIFSSEYCVA